MEDIINIPSRIIPGDKILTAGGSTSLGALIVAVGSTIGIKNNEVDFERTNKEIALRLRDEAEIDTKLREEDLTHVRNIVKLYTDKKIQVEYRCRGVTLKSEGPMGQDSIILNCP